MRIVLALAAALALMAAPAFAQTNAPAEGDDQAHVGAAFGPQRITPANAVENSFVAALSNPEMRPVFRRQLLEAQVAVALDAPGEASAPKLVPIQGDKQAAAIFTSAARLRGILGANAPYAMMTGRAALARLAEHNVAINYMWVPMLTLEPEDVAEWLETPETPRAAPPPAPDAAAIATDEPETETEAPAAETPAPAQTPN